MIIGRFYLRRTVNGNLIGEFSNNESLANFTESADLVGSANAGFIGSYISTWQENRAAVVADLNIGFKQNSNTIFTVIWTTTDQSTRYFGEGFIVNDMLIGDYVDVDANRALGLGRDIRQ